MLNKILFSIFMLLLSLCSKAQNGGGGSFADVVRVIPRPFTFSQIFPVGNKDFLRNAFVKQISGGDTIIFFVDTYGNFVKVRGVSGAASSLYTGSGTVPVGTVATVTDNVSFLGAGNYNFGLDHTMRITANGNEPGVLSMVANGDSITIDRSDFEFIINSRPKLVIKSNNDITLIADSTKVFGPVFVQDTLTVRGPIIVRTGGAGVALYNGIEDAYISVTEDGQMLIGTDPSSSAIIITGTSTVVGTLTAANFMTVSGKMKEGITTSNSAAASVTLSSTGVMNFYNPPADRADVTLLMPSSPATGDLCGLCFGKNITTITWSGNGNPIPLAFPTTAVSGDYFRFIFLSGFGWVKAK